MNTIAAVALVAPDVPATCTCPCETVAGTPGSHTIGRELLADRNVLASLMVQSLQTYVVYETTLSKVKR
jgi:hypothetical protein